MKTCNSGEETLEQKQQLSETGLLLPEVALQHHDLYLGLAEHFLWWLPGIACIQAGDCQYRAQQVGTPWGLCMCWGV